MPKKTSIVSSAHLDTEKVPGLSELEFAITIVNNAFQRWVARCVAASGGDDLAVLDVLVLHNINHRGRDKRMVDVCFMLNIEDSHLVNYSLKKLRRLGLVDGNRRGKEVFYRTTDQGIALCEHYREIREACLIDALSALGNAQDRDFSSLAGTLRALSGIYDQAARAASSL